jgi:hypothetical protein
MPAVHLSGLSSAGSSDDHDDGFGVQLLACKLVKVTTGFVARLRCHAEQRSSNVDEFNSVQRWWPNVHGLDHRTESPSTEVLGLSQATRGDPIVVANEPKAVTW